MFPKSLSAVVALRGEDEVRAVETMMAAVTKHFPGTASELAADLECLAKATVDAERRFREAERRWPRRSARSNWPARARRTSARS